MKKILALVLALLLVLGTFTACITVQPEETQKQTEKDTANSENHNAANITCKHIDDIIDHICDKCGSSVETHADKLKDGDHRCDYCKALMSLCEDLDNDHNCDECSKVLSTHTFTTQNGTHKCNYCTKYFTCTDVDKNNTCDECGGAIIISTHTLKDIRANLNYYNGCKVSFNGIISHIYDGSFYVEDYDEETDMYYGISVYYATAGLPGVALEQIAVGNMVRVVGTVGYFEPGDVWQVSGLTYRLMKPNDPANFKLISSGHTIPYILVSPVDFATKKVDITVIEGETEVVKSVDYASMILDTSISMKGLSVSSAKANKNNEITLTCTSGDVKISVFLGAMKDADGNAVTVDTFKDKTIDVKGIVDKYYENYQIHVFNIDDILIH